jgi:uncharacterized membrane protein YbhN (UPF0104 family)
LDICCTAIKQRIKINFYISVENFNNRDKVTCVLAWTAFVFANTLMLVTIENNYVVSNKFNFRTLPKETMEAKWKRYFFNFLTDRLIDAYSHFNVFNYQNQSRYRALRSINTIRQIVPYDEK